ncbi:MAG: hypothetical protein ABIH63_01035 [archaeon]
MDSKKGAPSFANPFVARGVSAKPKKEEKKSQQKGPNYLVLVGGLLVVVLLAFFFFRFVLDLDKLYSFEKNINAAVVKVSGYGVGTVKEVVIPLPNSVDKVCFSNVDYDSEVSFEPEKLSPFTLKGAIGVQDNPFCVLTAGSFRAKMQVFSIDGSSFVGIFLNSIDQQIVNPVYVEVNVTQNETFTPEVPPETNETNQTSNNTLSEIQQASCQYAAENNNCDKLADLGIVTKEQCCSIMSFCC